MRKVVVLALVTASCAGRAPEPLPLPIVARGEVIAPPVPAFGGIVHTGPCAIRFEPASADERRERVAAYRARLPRGATVELTELGDRARKVSIAIALPHEPRRAEAKRAMRAAEDFAHDTAELWGWQPRAFHTQWKGEPARHVYAFEYEGVPSMSGTLWDEHARLVVRVDLRRGRLDAGVIGDPLPEASVCDHPAIDATRATAAALGYPISQRDILTAADLGEPMPLLVVRDNRAAYVAAVPFGRGLAAMMASRPSDARMAVKGFVLVDPDDDHVLGVEPAPYLGPVDPWYSAAGDADALFGECPGADD